MRAVSFVSRLEFEFRGNISRNAICLGDVDNDGDNELVVGNLQGDMAIFKGQNCRSRADAKGLGMVMVVLVGDILNKGKNCVVCISGEGFCNIFDLKNGSISDGEKKTLTPFHSQTLPANTKVALLADVDGDGELELVLGLTDHVLRTYRWVGIGQDRSDATGKLVGLHKWEFAEQIGSISLNPCPDGSPYVLVAQPGGTYINFQCSLQLAEDVTDKTVLSKLTPKHHPLASSRMRNPNISSEILGGIHGVHDGRKKDDLIAVATLDGTLMLVDGDDTIWSLQVDHQLFAITKLDLTGNGEEEVIACAWGGQTYIVNQQRQSVRFKFDDPVCTFTSGLYSVQSGKSVPALVYGTFCDRIYLYYDVCLPFFRVQTLLEAVEEHPEASELSTRFPVDASDLLRLYSLCLYAFPSHLQQDEAK